MYTSHAVETVEREREGVSCTCEYLGAQFSGHHGNPPHLSATAAGSSRRTHTQYMNAHTHTYSYIVCPPSCQSHFSVSSCLSLLFSCLPSVFSSLFIRLSTPLNSCLPFASSLFFLFFFYPVHSLQSDINEGGSYALILMRIEKT